MADNGQAKAGRPSPPGKPNGDPSTRSLGMSESTLANRRSGLKLFNTWRKINKERPFEDLRETDVSENWMFSILLTFILFCATTPIPKDYGENFEAPSNLKNPILGIMVISTIDCYIRGFICCMREKFPTHPIWPAKWSELPELISRQLKGMIKEWTRLKNDVWSKDPNFKFGEMVCRTIYPRVQDRVYSSLWEDDQLKKWYGSSELEDLSKNDWSRITFFSLLKTGFRRMHRTNPASISGCSKMMDTYSHIMRGGEVKNSRWKDKKYLVMLQLLGDLKHQTKVLTTALASPNTWNSKEPLLCSEFWRGCYLFYGKAQEELLFKSQTTKLILCIQRNRTIPPLVSPGDRQPSCAVYCHRTCPPRSRRSIQSSPSERVPSTHQWSCIRWVG